MTKVAIIIPTMNRPDFILRQLRFYELMGSPHPLYLSDSSNEENAQKMRNIVKQFKNLNITYQWAVPGKDRLHELLPLVKEKYCIQMGDDDLMIPETISECADFLENNPDYGICVGNQVNIRFQDEDYNQPYGIIKRYVRLPGRSIEEDDIVLRAQNYWSDTYNSPFICFTVRKTDLERSLRNITKHFSLMDSMTEFLIMSILITSGKYKVLDKLGYIMQINNNRYSFVESSYTDFMLSPGFNDKWKICEEGLAEIICRTGVPREKSFKIVRQLFTLNLADQFVRESLGLSVGRKVSKVSNKNLLKKLRYFISSNHFLKNIYYKFNPPIENISRPESKYFNDFKAVKDFLENSNI